MGLWLRSSSREARRLHPGRLEMHCTDRAPRVPPTPRAVASRPVDFVEKQHFPLEYALQILLSVCDIRQKCLGSAKQQSEESLRDHLQRTADQRVSRSCCRPAERLHCRECWKQGNCLLGFESAESSLYWKAK